MLTALASTALWYQFPIGDSFTATVGGLVRQDDMLAVWPSAYPADTVIDFFTYAGAPATYNLGLGQGAGLSWASDDFSISANYLSKNGSLSDPNAGGIATDAAGSNGTVQIAYAPENWGIAAAYNYASQNSGTLYPGNGTPLAVQATGDGNDFSISANYVTGNGSVSDPNAGGIATDGAASNGTVQIAYAPENWGIAAAYNYASKNGGTLYAGNGTPLANTFTSNGNNSSVGLSAWWSPEEVWLVPIHQHWLGLQQCYQRRQRHFPRSGYPVLVCGTAVG